MKRTIVVISGNMDSKDADVLKNAFDKLSQYNDRIPLLFLGEGISISTLEVDVPERKLPKEPNERNN